MRLLAIIFPVLILHSLCLVVQAGGSDSRPPNILFCISDDQSWLHTGAMGDPIVQTPAFDRIAKEGILFTNAFSDAPSCGPSRSAILCGQHIWRLAEAGNIHSKLPSYLPTYVKVLKQQGYAVGSYSKAWSPGMFEVDTGWVHNSRTHLNPAGPRFESFAAFYSSKKPNQPFCFWLGSSDAHRPYTLNSGRESGMDPLEVEVPQHLPDHPVVRNDILDYYFEIQRFDRLVGEAVALLDASGELDNTIIVVTSDNGMPFPRAKATLYDYGTHMPLAIRWPNGIFDPGRSYHGFVHLSDLAATFLTAVGLPIPKQMTAKSLTDIFTKPRKKNRTFAVTAMERHDGCRKGGKGYPCRAIRTKNHLYILNYEPDRWASGDPDSNQCARSIPFGEVDPCPTKSLLLQNPSQFGRYYQLSFGKRPAEELYDLTADPGQLSNVASIPSYRKIKKKLHRQLKHYTAQTGDPRALGQDAPWDYYAYYGYRKNKNWQVDEKPLTERNR